MNPLSYGALPGLDPLGELVTLPRIRNRLGRLRSAPRTGTPLASFLPNPTLAPTVPSGRACQQLPIFWTNNACWRDSKLRHTSQRDAFCEAWKALKSVFGQGSATDPAVAASSDSIVGWKAKTSSPFRTPQRFQRLRLGAFGVESVTPSPPNRRPLAVTSGSAPVSSCPFSEPRNAPERRILHYKYNERFERRVHRAVRLCLWNVYILNVVVKQEILIETQESKTLQATYCRVICNKVQFITKISSHDKTSLYTTLTVWKLVTNIVTKKRMFCGLPHCDAATYSYPPVKTLAPRTPE